MRTYIAQYNFTLMQHRRARVRACATQRVRVHVGGCVLATCKIQL